MLVPIDKHKAQKKVGRLQALPAKPKAPKPDIRQSQNYLNAVKQADLAKQEAQKASSLKGFLGNALKAVPRATADVTVGTPAKFLASTAEIPETILKKGQTSQRTYKLPLLSPFKSYQSDFQNVANDVIDNKKPLASAALEMAKVPLAGLEMLGVTKGLGMAGKAAKAGKFGEAGANVVDAFLPTTRGLKPQTLSPARKLITSGETVLNKSGQGGQELTSLMEKQRVEGDLLGGQWKGRFQELIHGLSKEEKLNLTDVLEGKANPLSDSVNSVAVKTRSLLDEIQGKAKDTGLDVGYRENYFPRNYNWDEMKKASNQEKILQHMVDTGQASTKAEAEKFLNDFVSKNRERKAGNLEYERMFDIPGYEKDPEKALMMYADSASRRISEVATFGKKDEVASALINKIADEGGDYKQAQKIFDYVYKGEDKNAFANFLLSYNTFSKLSLSFFSNVTQSVNTAAKGGLLNTLKGAGQALAQGIKAVKGKNYDDIALLSNALDEAMGNQETGVLNNFTKSVMYMFQKVENFNRRTAAYAGKYRAEELAGLLSKDPQNAFAIRQLDSLGIKVDDVINGKLTEKQLLTAANKMAKITQFKMNALSMPQAWRTPLGKVLTQFKGFSFMQTKFIRDEIIKEAGQGNFAPLVRFLMLAPVASFATQSARNMVNMVDKENEKINPSFRKLDLYRKAIGDIPTDLATQMQYAFEKSKSEYTTPIQNVKNFSSPFIGPSIGDALTVTSGLEKAGSIDKTNRMFYENHPLAQQDPYLDLKRFGVSKIPYVGGAIKNTQFPYEKTTAVQAKEQAKAALLSGDYDKFLEALQKDPYLNDKEVIQRLISDTVDDSKSDKEKRMYRELMNKQYNPFYK